MPRKEATAMPEPTEMEVMRNLQHLQIDRLEALTDRIEALSDTVKELADIMSQPPSTDLRDILTDLTTVVRDVSEQMKTLPGAILDEIDRRRAGTDKGGW